MTFQNTHKNLVYVLVRLDSSIAQWFELPTGILEGGGFDFRWGTQKVMGSTLVGEFRKIYFLSKRPFPSSLVPLFQSESKGEIILMKMTLICMKMKLHAELIFI